MRRYLRRKKKRGGGGGAITCSISRVKQTNTRRQKRALLASRAVCDLSHHDKGEKSENKNRERHFFNLRYFPSDRREAEGLRFVCNKAIRFIFLFYWIILVRSNIGSSGQDGGNRRE